MYIQYIKKAANVFVKSLARSIAVKTQQILDTLIVSAGYRAVSVLPGRGVRRRVRVIPQFHSLSEHSRLNFSPCDNCEKLQQLELDISNNLSGIDMINSTRLVCFQIPDINAHAPTTGCYTAYAV
jgi:hypothetical protein